MDIGRFHLFPPNHAVEQRATCEVALCADAAPVLLMSCFRYILFFHASLILAVHADDVSTHFSYGNGKIYAFSISSEQLARSPAWRTGEPFPPLSPGKAGELAVGLLPELTASAKFPTLSPRKAGELAIGLLPELATDSGKWEIHSICLENLRGMHRWIYVVEIFGPPSVIDGFPALLRIPVLMDGTVIRPRISNDKASE